MCRVIPLVLRTQSSTASRWLHVLFGFIVRFWIDFHLYEFSIQFDFMLVSGVSHLLSLAYNFLLHFQILLLFRKVTSISYSLMILFSCHMRYWTQSIFFLIQNGQDCCFYFIFFSVQIKTSSKYVYMIMQTILFRSHLGRIFPVVYDAFLYILFASYFDQMWLFRFFRAVSVEKVH